MRPRARHSSALEAWPLHRDYVSSVGFQNQILGSYDPHRQSPVSRLGDSRKQTSPAPGAHRSEALSPPDFLPACPIPSNINPYRPTELPWSPYRLKLYSASTCDGVDSSFHGTTMYQNHVFAENFHFLIFIPLRFLSQGNPIQF